MIIRIASLDDVRDIVDIHCSDVDKWYKWVSGSKIEDSYENLSVWDRWGNGGPWMSIETCAIHINYLLNSGQYPLVAVVDGKVVGELELYIGVEKSIRYAHIDILWVHKKYRGRGVGRKLVYKAIEIARENDCRKIMVWPDKKAVEFYKKCGLNEVENIVSMDIDLNKNVVNDDEIYEVKEIPDKYSVGEMNFISPRCTASFTAWLKNKWKYYGESKLVKSVEGYISKLESIFIIKSMWADWSRAKLTLWIKDIDNLSEAMANILRIGRDNGFDKLNINISIDCYQKFMKKYVHTFLEKNIVLIKHLS